MITRCFRKAAALSRQLRCWATRTFWPWAGLNDYERRVYSQNGEDGIIQEIFRRVGTTNRFFVEFGVGDGTQCNAAYLARAKDWSGLMLEADPDVAQKLKPAYAAFHRVRTECRRLTTENILATFAELDVPSDFDLLSIDVDGNDYWLWRALAAYRPRAVVIEYNAVYPPPTRWVMAYDPEHAWDGTTYHGASLASLAALGKRLGYALIGTERLGVNAFFLARDLLPAAHFRELSPQRAYHAPRYGPQGRGHPPGSGPAVSI